MVIELMTEDRVRQIIREELARTERRASGWLRLEDAAAHLGYSVKTLRRRIKEGAVETSKDGKSQFVKLDDLEKMREQKKATSGKVATRG